MRIAIIGAGLAGLTAARRLHEAGLAPVVYDKGRGPGGRLSTRRAGEGLQFDHGAQYLAPESAGFADFLEGAAQAGAAGRWALEGGRTVWVGLPGMNEIVRHLAHGLDLRQGTEIRSVARAGSGWALDGTAFDKVISTIPAPQAATLLGPACPQFVAPLAGVEMEPSLTLMLAHRPGLAIPFETRRDPEAPIAWLARDGAKPGRPCPEAWVAQASVAWSAAHIDHEKEEIAELMCPMVCEILGIGLDDVTHAVAHRWRYAQASRPLGQPYLAEGGSLFAGGDWALSARAEGAWQSGRAMAEAALNA